MAPEKLRVLICSCANNELQKTIPKKNKERSAF
jgi:hypothetical protein